MKQKSSQGTLGSYEKIISGITPRKTEEGEDYGKEELSWERNYMSREKGGEGGRGKEDNNFVFSGGGESKPLA